MQEQTNCTEISVNQVTQVRKVTMEMTEHLVNVVRRAKMGPKVSKGLKVLLDSRDYLDFRYNL